MAKGTPAMGKKNKKASHIPCRRCGERAYHRTKSVCSSCGYGKSAKMRTYAWQAF